MKKQLKLLSKKFNNLIKTIKTSPKKLIILLVIIILAVGLYFGKSLFIVAVVNNQPIWRLELIRELEKQGGKKVLDSIITQNLVLQEAQKQKVSVGQAEIDAAIKQIEDNVTKQGSKLDELLASQGLTRNDLRDQIKFQKLAEKILSKEVKVTDADIKDYYDKNKDTTYKDKTLEEVKEEIKQLLTQQQLSEKLSSWIDQLHSKAKINYFIKF